MHGCLDELQALLEKAQYDRQKDSVVLVGDLVNKGPKSAETVRYAREQGFYSVRGAFGGGEGSPKCQWMGAQEGPYTDTYVNRNPALASLPPREQATTTTARWPPTSSADAFGRAFFLKATLTCATSARQTCAG